MVKPHHYFRHYNSKVLLMFQGIQEHHLLQYHLESLSAMPAARGKDVANRPRVAYGQPVLRWQAKQQTLMWVPLVAHLFLLKLDPPTHPHPHHLLLQWEFHWMCVNKKKSTWCCIFHLHTTMANITAMNLSGTAATRGEEKSGGIP